MILTQKAERFADRHCGRSVPDNKIDKESREWYYRLYLRFVQHELQKMPHLRIYTSVSCPGLVEEHAADFLYENPQFHCERGATCPTCVAHHDRDVNAAMNILRQGIASSGSTCKTRLAEQGASATGESPLL